MTRLEGSVQGIWWLPGEHRRSRHGVLQQLPTSHFELTLQKAWPQDVMNAVDRAEYLTVLGKDSAGRPISLLAGFLKEYNLLAPERSPAVFHFDRAFLGAHFLNEDSVNLTELSARIPAVDHWLGISGFAIDGPPRSWRDLTIHFSQPDDLEFELEPGLKLVFGFSWRGLSLRRPQLETSLCQEAWLILEAEPARGFAELATTFHRLVDLLSLLTGEALGFESLSAKPKRPGRSVQKDDRQPTIDILFSPVAPELVNKIVEGHHMLLRFKDIQLAHPNIFQRWLEKYNAYAPAFNAYFSTQRKLPAYQEQKFLSLVQSLETLHRLSSQVQASEEHQKRLERIKKNCPEDWEWLEGRLRYSHEPILSKRLTDLLRPFKDLFGNRERRDRFAQRTADTRNYFTHYDPVQESKAVKPSRLTPYIFRLNVLFILRCLIELGFSPDEARQHVERNHRLRQMVQFGKI